MKKGSLILLLFFLVVGLSLQAQEQTRSKFGFIVFQGMGLGSLQNEDGFNSNLNALSSEYLLHYQFGGKFGIATGIGLTRLKGNGFNSDGNYSQFRNFFKIPVMMTSQQKLTDKSKFIINLGIYGNRIMEDRYTYINTVLENVYEGWDFGMQMRVGFVHELNSRLNIGLSYNGQFGFTDLSPNAGLSFVSNQKMNMNTLDLMFEVQF